MCLLQLEARLQLSQAPLKLFPSFRVPPGLLTGAGEEGCREVVQGKMKSASLPDGLDLS